VTPKPETELRVTPRPKREPKTPKIECKIPAFPNAAGTKCLCPQGHRMRNQVCTPIERERPREEERRRPDVSPGDVIRGVDDFFGGRDDRRKRHDREEKGEDRRRGEDSEEVRRPREPRIEERNPEEDVKPRNPTRGQP
jgi:hypothetical protein